MNSEDDKYVKARDAAAEEIAHDTWLKDFENGADWSRQFTRDEIMNSSEMKGVIEALDYYIKNCELVGYELVGGDGAPSGHLPYPMEWTAAINALAAFRKRFGGGGE